MLFFFATLKWESSSYAIYKFFRIYPIPKLDTSNNSPLQFKHGIKYSKIIQDGHYKNRPFFNVGIHFVSILIMYKYITLSTQCTRVGRRKIIYRGIKMRLPNIPIKPNLSNKSQIFKKKYF